MHSESTRNKPLRVVHIISGLNVGGAQTMLHRLLRVADTERFSQQVLCLTGVGPVGRRMRDEGFDVEAADLKSPRGWTHILPQVLRDLRASPPAIVQGWMYHGNIASNMIARRLSPRPSIIWNIRHSIDNLDGDKVSTRATIKLGKHFSAVPGAIIYNSHAAATQHEALGYNSSRRMVLPNGFDTALFSPSAEKRAAFRQTFGLANHDILMGHIARYHPTKNHLGLLAAAHTVLKKHKNVHLALAGPRVTQDNSALSRAVAETGAAERIHILGPLEHVHELTPVFDIAISPSDGEGFPNTVAEAMACGVPCVVTDVGDSARVVGKTGIVVPPGNADALATACLALIEAPSAERDRLGRAARERIESEYSLEHIAKAYEHAYAVQAEMDRDAN